MKLNNLLIEQLAALGVQHPAPAHLNALEAHLAPRIAALVQRALTKRLVAQTFAATLLNVERHTGSTEGGNAPALSSSVEASTPKHGTGATNTEAV